MNREEQNKLFSLLNDNQKRYICEQIKIERCYGDCSEVEKFACNLFGDENISFMYDKFLFGKDYE